MQYTSETADSAEVLRHVGDALGENPDLLQGFLVIGMRIDGAMIVAHNSCCLGHIIEAVIANMHEFPDLKMLNPGFTDEHRP